MPNKFIKYKKQINWSISRTYTRFVSLIQDVFHFLAQILAAAFLIGLTRLACLRFCLVLVLGLISLLYHFAMHYCIKSCASLPLKHSILRCTTM